MSTPTSSIPSRRSFDVVFVGAGHNALVAAAYLAKAGRSVALLERAGTPGGFVRTEELTLPGFLHDTYSAVHPVLASGPVLAELGPDLADLGLTYVQGPLSTGASLPDGRTAVVPTDAGALAAELERLGEHAAWTELLAGLAPHLSSLVPLFGWDLTTPAAVALVDELESRPATSALPFASSRAARPTWSTGGSGRRSCARCSCRGRCTSVSGRTTRAAPCGRRCASRC